MSGTSETYVHAPTSEHKIEDGLKRCPPSSSKSLFPQQLYKETRISNAPQRILQELVKLVLNNFFLQRLEPVNIPSITVKLLRLLHKTRHLTLKLLN